MTFREWKEGREREERETSIACLQYEPELGLGSEPAAEVRVLEQERNRDLSVGAPTSTLTAEPNRPGPGLISIPS